MGMGQNPIRGNCVKTFASFCKKKKLRRSNREKGLSWTDGVTRWSRASSFFWRWSWVPSFPQSTSSHPGKAQVSAENIGVSDKTAEQRDFLTSIRKEISVWMEVIKSFYNIFLDRSFSSRWDSSRNWRLNESDDFLQKFIPNWSKEIWIKNLLLFIEIRIKI